MINNRKYDIILTKKLIKKGKNQMSKQTRKRRKGKKIILRYIITIICIILLGLVAQGLEYRKENNDRTNSINEIENNRNNPKHRNRR